MNPFIRTMEARDLPFIVRVHLASFRGFFLTFLGPAFLLELYSGILADPSGIAFVAQDDGQIVGFVAGASESAGLYSRLLRHRWWRFALVSLAPVLRNPRIVPRLLRAIKKPKLERAAGNEGTLMSIAVLPEKQGRGIGQALVQAFLAEAIRRGLSKVNLTTDKVDNDAVNLFYQRLGFVCVRHFTTPEGRPMNEYEIALPPKGKQ